MVLILRYGDWQGFVQKLILELGVQNRENFTLSQIIVSVHSTPPPELMGDLSLI